MERFGARMPASSTSQPSLVADMLELLELTCGVGVLEIGAGTGYNAALLAELVGDQRLVITVDVAEDVVAQTRRLLAGAGYPGITVLCRDGFDGVPERAPFDRIVATVGCADVSPHWAEQLAEDGRLLVPLRHAGGHPLLLLRREAGGLGGRVTGWSGFMDARGQLHADGLWSMGIAQPDDQGEVGEREPWPGFGADETDPGPDDPVDEQDFLFYLSLVDRRACWAPGGVALSDGLNGWAQPTRAASAGGGTKPWPTTSTITTPNGWPSAAPRSATTGWPSSPSRRAAHPRPRAGHWTAPPSANSSGSRSTDLVSSRERRSKSANIQSSDWVVQVSRSRNRNSISRVLVGVVGADMVMLAPLRSGFANQDEADPQWTHPHADRLGQPAGGRRQHPCADGGTSCAEGTPHWIHCWPSPGWWVQVGEECLRVAVNPNAEGSHRLQVARWRPPKQRSWGKARRRPSGGGAAGVSGAPDREADRERPLAQH